MAEELTNYYRGHNRTLRHRVRELERERDDLIAALRPFADAARVRDLTAADDHLVLADHPPGGHISYGDLRRARDLVYPAQRS